MAEDKKEYIKTRLKLADDKLIVANDLFKDRHYREVVSVCYYAMFYAVKALFLAEDIKETKTHEGVKTIFGKYCLEQGKLDRSYAKIFAVAQEARIRADYKEMVIVSQDEARQSLAETKNFVKILKKKISLNH